MSRRRPCAGAAFALALALAAAGAGAQQVENAPGAVLRGLDKVASQTRDIELATGETVAFGSLSLTLDECRYPAGDPAANAYAHLRIRDQRSGVVIFDGWMIASSPALSALDHPRYDVWVLRCSSA
ncbi:DUF2155 domain-containing protein [Albidovulum sp.]